MVDRRHGHSVSSSALAAGSLEAGYGDGGPRRGSLVASGARSRPGDGTWWRRPMKLGKEAFGDRRRVELGGGRCMRWRWWCSAHFIGSIRREAAGRRRECATVVGFHGVSY
jgi:hypothetical protein